MNPTPIFTSAAWHSPSPGVWEAQATPPTLNGNPPYEAVCCRLAGSPGAWSYRTYRQLSDDGDTLAEIDSGVARTLHAAQRGADRIARHWRDHPTTPTQPLTTYTRFSVVVCDTCGTHQQLEHLLHTNRCLGDNDQCNCDTFDGYTLDQLAQAVTQ